MQNRRRRDRLRNALSILQNVSALLGVVSFVESTNTFQLVVDFVSGLGALFAYVVQVLHSIAQFLGAIYRAIIWPLFDLLLPHLPHEVRDALFVASVLIAPSLYSAFFQTSRLRKARREFERVLEEFRNVTSEENFAQTLGAKRQLNGAIQSALDMRFPIVRLLAASTALTAFSATEYLAFEVHYASLPLALSLLGLATSVGFYIALRNTVVQSNLSLRALEVRANKQMIDAQRRFEEKWRREDHALTEELRGLQRQEEVFSIVAMGEEERRKALESLNKRYDDWRREDLERTFRRQPHRQLNGEERLERDAGQARISTILRLLEERRQLRSLKLQQDPWRRNRSK